MSGNAANHPKMCKLILVNCIKFIVNLNQGIKNMKTGVRSNILF